MGIVTLAIFVGGIFLFSRAGTSTNVVNSALLVPQNAIVTSGFANGNYLPASPSASVTLVEFGDYECPACGLYSPLTKQLLTDFAGKINYIFRNYPLPQHKNANISSYAVEAAGLQGKYLEMHEKMYATQGDWSNLSYPTSVFVGYAEGFGLNVDQFTTDINLPAVKDKVKSDFNDGNTIGITQTPTFYLNGKKVTLSGSYDQLKGLIESALAGK